MAVFSSCGCMDWLLIGGLLLAAAYLYLTWTYNFWKNKGVVYVEPKLIFGNLKDNIMVKKTIGQVYADLYHELKGHKYGGIFKLRQPALLIRDPELIKSVLVKDFSSFHDNDIHVTVDDDPMLGRSPFCLQGDRWKVVRTQVSPAFTTAKIRPLFPLINRVCDSMKEYLNAHQTDPCLDAKEVAAKFTTDNVASCTFGLEGNSFTDPNAVFRTMGRRLMEPEFWKNARQMCILLVPWLARMLKLKFIEGAVADFFRGILKDAMTYREKNNVTRNDFLQLMMQLKAKGKVDGDDTVQTKSQYEAFTDEDVAAHASSFFIDGFDTSSTTLAHALFELAANPDLMARLRGEVDSALAANGEKLNHEMLQNLPYLEMVIAESMRKYPPAQFLNRLCTKPYDLPTPDGGVCRLPVGTSVVVPVYALHHDPDIFPDPERFDPERFNEANKEQRHKMVYLPFGEGPRICLGMKFAMTQVKAGLVSIVSNFDMTVNKKTRVPLVPDPKLFVLSSMGGLWLNFTPRAK